MQLSYKCTKSKIFAFTLGLLSMVALAPSSTAQHAVPQFAQYKNANQSGLQLIAQRPPFADGDQGFRRRRGGGRLDNNAFTTSPDFDGRGRGGSMSGRFKKYMNNDQMNNDFGGRGGRGGGGGMRRKMQQRLQQMPAEQRQLFMQKMQGMSKQERQQFFRQMRSRGGGEGFPGAKRSRNRGPHVREHRSRRGGRSRAGKMRGGRQWFGRKPIDLGRLNLSQKQKTKIQKMRQANAMRARSVNKKLKMRRTRMKEMMFDPTATRAQILKERAAYSQLRNQADEIMLNDFLDIRSVLTKKQLNHLPEIKPGRRRSAPPKAPAIGSESPGL